MTDSGPMTDIQDDLTLAVLLAEVREPDLNCPVWVRGHGEDDALSLAHRLMWDSPERTVIVQVNQHGWVISQQRQEGASGRWITFPELLALFQNPEYRERWGLNPP